MNADGVAEVEFALHKLSQRGISIKTVYLLPKYTRTINTDHVGSTNTQAQITKLKFINFRVWVHQTAVQ